MNRARLIIDPPANGAWNMAVDQALLETASESGLTTLRFYQWDEPTLSLGYFQKHEDRALHPPSLTCPLVRRRTGGGAILHHSELTYSLCVPSSNRWCAKNAELYEAIHLMVIGYLQQKSIRASLYRETTAAVKTPVFNAASNETEDKNNRPRIDPSAFLCFGRRSAGDVVMQGYKIMGSAQRRGKNALLQHGSLLLERSRFAPELPGIEDISGGQISLKKTIEKLSASAENELRIELFAGMLSKLELEAAKRIFFELFGNQQWNLCR